MCQPGLSFFLCALACAISLIITSKVTKIERDVCKYPKIGYKCVFIDRLFHHFLFNKDPCNDTGMGRFVALLDPLSIEKCIEKVKAHLEIEHVQLALGQGKTLGKP